jgi:hypothetical protein
VEINASADLASIYPHARLEETKERWRPSALIVAAQDYRLIIVDQDNKPAMFSLREGKQRDWR